MIHMCIWRREWCPVDIAVFSCSSLLCLDGFQGVFEILCPLVVVSVCYYVEHLVGVQQPSVYCQRWAPLRLANELRRSVLLGDVPRGVPDLQPIQSMEGVYWFELACVVSCCSLRVFAFGVPLWVYCLSPLFFLCIFFCSFYFFFVCISCAPLLMIQNKEDKNAL